MRLDATNNCGVGELYGIITWTSKEIIDDVIWELFEDCNQFPELDDFTLHSDKWESGSNATRAEARARDWKDFEKAVNAWKKQNGPGLAYIFFTGATRSPRSYALYAEKLCKYIEAHYLGTVRVSPPARNPNTGKYISVYVWELNQKGVTEYYIAQEYERQGVD